MSDDCECEECESGAPAWMATFADLMSLLMCFFVLLLSFSEMDIQKYKQVAGSMKQAFGIQRLVKSDQIPKGTTIISQEFSPGKPEPTMINEVRQQTTDEMQESIEVNPEIEITPEIRAEIESLADKIRMELKEEIERGILEIIVDYDAVLIRVREQDAFPSGSAALQPAFVPILEKLMEALGETDTDIVVAGHTDNVPINTALYPSNWVLSSARAASVVHQLADIGLRDPSRIEIRAYADTQPIAPNDSPQNRARNRRVEINVSVRNSDAAAVDTMNRIKDELGGEVIGVGEGADGDIDFGNLEESGRAPGGIPMPDTLRLDRLPSGGPMPGLSGDDEATQ